MNFIELIGFLIAFAALIFSIVRKAMEERRRRLDPEGYAKELEEEERQYKEMLKEMGFEPKPERKVPPPKPVSKAVARKRQLPKQTTHRTLSEKFEYHSSIEDRGPVTELEDRRIGTRIQPKFQEGYGQRLVSEELRSQKVQKQAVKHSKLANKLGALPSKRAWILAHEVIGPPKGIISSRETL